MHYPDGSIMSLPTEVKSLEFDLPACPKALLDLSMLLSDEDTPVHAIAELIERDMALAAAVVRTVNSAMFGLQRRVETVGEAVRYLGTREVTAITFEIGLRAAFAPSKALDELWDRSSRRGLLMGRSARPLGIDPFLAHTAGLFARSGQAVFLAKAERYQFMLVQHAGQPLALSQAEIDSFGVTHAALGSALCRVWGLAAEVSEFVREQGRGCKPGDLDWAAQPETVRELLVLGAVCDAVIGGEDPAEVAQRLSHWVQCTPADLLSAVLSPWEQVSTLNEALLAD